MSKLMDKRKEKKEESPLKPGAVCSKCGRTVTEAEYSYGGSKCCDADVTGEEHYAGAKKATDLVSKATLDQALQEARAAAQKLDRNAPEHKTLEEMYNFISEILGKTDQEIKADGGQVLTDYFDDTKMPQFAGKLRSAVEKINQIRTQAMAVHASLTKMDAKIKAQARDALAGMSDSVGYSAKQECLIAKHGYFYSHGYDERKFADAIVKRLNAVGLRANIVSTSNHWNAWPTDSWFECRFTVEPSPIANTPAPAVPAVTEAPIPEPSKVGPQPRLKGNYDLGVDIGEASAPVTSSVEKEAAPEIEVEEDRPLTIFHGELLKYDPDDFVAICDSRNGWSVKAQCKSILDGEPFEEQNSNALRLIMELAKSKKETELATAIQEYLTMIGYKQGSKTADEFTPKPVGESSKNKTPGTSTPKSTAPSSTAKPVSTAPAKPKSHSPSPAAKTHSPSSVPVIAAEKVAMPLNYEQILSENGFQRDPSQWDGKPSPNGEEIYWDGSKAVVIYSDGNWEAFGGNGPNDVIAEGHGPEEMQTHFNLMAQDEFENRKGSDMNKRANSKIAEEPIETPIVEDEEDIVPVEDAPVDEAVAPASTVGLDPASLGTKALGAAIKALAGVPEFMDDKSAVLWIEQLSSILKDRPVEQKAAKSNKAPHKCECGAKCMNDSDMCGACEKEYAMENEKAASVNKTAVAPPGWEDTVKKMKKEKGIDNPYALAWHMKDEGYTPHRASYLIGKNAKYFVDKFAAGNANGGFTSDQDTMEVEKGESEGSDRVKEIAQAHKLRDDNTGIDRPATVLPSKLAAEMTPAKCLKACEDAKEDLKKLYLDLKHVCKVNDVAAVRNAIESVWSAATLFDDAAKAFNKMIMAEEAEEEATKASKKESSKEASFGGLVLAAAAE
jgi:hypothetical protein